MERLAPFLDGTTSLVVNLLFGPVFIVIGLFIGAGLFHLCSSPSAAATRGFEATFRVAAFSQAASIFNIIPGCGGLIGLVYTLVLLVIGLSEAHQISRGKAAAAVLVPFVARLLLLRRAMPSPSSGSPARSANAVTRVKLVARPGATPLGAIFLACGVVVAAAVGLLHLDRLPITLCAFKAVTGVPCLGCGTTRAFARLFDLDVPGAVA